VLGSGLDALAVNPGAVFGPARTPSNTARFLRLLALGRLGPLAPPGSLSVVGLADVVEGIRLALERGRPGRRYLLTAENHTLLELFRLAQAALGSRPSSWGRAPRPLWSALSLLASGVDRVRALDLTTPQSLRLLGLHFRFDSRRAREELGFEPRPFAEVLAETIAWMRSRSWIP
jgi:dihydroflavonol-4-reductase